MSTKAKTPVAAAERMRTEIDCLVQKGFLKPERRHDHRAIQSAIDGFICHALGPEQDEPSAP